jgi:hypothetical protein
VNVCTICQADGVIICAGRWYCKDHLNDGFIATAVMIARIRQHDEATAAERAAGWAVDYL